MRATVRFPKKSQTQGLQRIQSTYTVQDIQRQFGLSEGSIRQWTRKGVISALPETENGDLRYDFYALTRFRQIRELRNRGMTMRQIELEMQGQLNLFPEKEGRLITLPLRRSPFEEALLLHERGDDMAQEMYQLAIFEDECVADAYCNLGVLEFEKNNTPKAFDCFTNALKHDPRHFESHYNLAHIYFEAEDYRLAHFHYEISAVLEPNSISVHFNLGLIYAAKGDLDAAVDELNKAKECSTGEEQVQIEEMLGSLREAAKHNRQMQDQQEILPE
ncbi:MAG: tetratricopeptide repeat protein [Acidobacteriota bacterium]